MTLLITGEDVKKLPLSAREAAMTVKTCELAGRAGWAARSTLGDLKPVTGGMAWPK